MSDEKKSGLLKKIGKAGTDSAKGAIKGTITGAAAGVVKEGIKQAADSSGLTQKSEETKSGIQGQLKDKENEIKKKIVKEAFKKSFK